MCTINVTVIWLHFRGIDLLLELTERRDCREDSKAETRSKGGSRDGKGVNAGVPGWLVSLGSVVFCVSEEIIKGLAWQLFRSIQLCLYVLTVSPGVLHHHWCVSQHLLVPPNLLPSKPACSSTWIRKVASGSTQNKPDTIIMSILENSPAAVQPVLLHAWTDML